MYQMLLIALIEVTAIAAALHLGDVQQSSIEHTTGEMMILVMAVICCVLYMLIIFAVWVSIFSESPMYPELVMLMASVPSDSACEVHIMSFWAYVL